MRSAITRAWERLSNSRSLSISTSAPASIRSAAARWVAAVVLLNRKHPVSVATPVYRQEAISGVILAPISGMSVVSSSAAAAAPSSTSVS